jgi:hypothetical protein
MGQDETRLLIISISLIILFPVCFSTNTINYTEIEKRRMLNKKEPIIPNCIFILTISISILFIILISDYCNNFKF